MKPNTLCLFLFSLLTYFAATLGVEAVVPAPDGGYPGGNTAEGQNALFSLTTGTFNTAVGVFSLRSNTFAEFNTGVGAGALLANNANQNTATGAAALLSNTTGDSNTANGAFALLSNTNGSLNTATGVNALFSNIGGTANTANGVSALLSNTVGHDNTANGLSSLYSNITGNNNTADGSGALYGNIDGDSNTAVGAGALLNNTSGASNTANGLQALYFNTTGSNNIAFGAFAGSNLTSGNDNIDIGNFGVADESGAIRIGSEFQTRTFIAAIRGVTTGVADAVNVVIDSNGQLGTLSSSRRFKKEIKAMDMASEAVLALKPVTFHYKSDKTDTPQFGLIAEEVAKVNPALVVRDKNGEVYTVRYDAVNAMLLNEFLKEHRKVEKLEAMVAQQHKDFEATLADLKGQIQKVSAQLAAASPSLADLK